jgi:hypothetical protein
MLFPVSTLKSKLISSTSPCGSRFRIFTGAPRFVESSTVCQEQTSEIAWEKLIEAISRAAIARLALLKGRAGKELAPCPWEKFTGCCRDCRCNGQREVTVDFLRMHYARLAIEIARLGRLSPELRK